MPSRCKNQHHTLQFVTPRQHLGSHTHRCGLCLRLGTVYADSLNLLHRGLHACDQLRACTTSKLSQTRTSRAQVRASAQRRVPLWHPSRSECSACDEVVSTSTSAKQHYPLAVNPVRVATIRISLQIRAPTGPLGFRRQLGSQLGICC